MFYKITTPVERKSDLKMFVVIHTPSGTYRYERTAFDPNNPTSIRYEIGDIMNKYKKTLSSLNVCLEPLWVEESDCEITLAFSAQPDLSKKSKEINAYHNAAKCHVYTEDKASPITTQSYYGAA